MAALEVIVGSFHHPADPAFGSSSFISIKPAFHPTFEVGRSCKRPPLPPLQASMSSTEDHGATLHKDNEERSGRRPVLKALQEGQVSYAVMQQVSSLRHFFMPELPFAIITEIKKRIPLSFREDDEEAMHDLSGGVIVEKEVVEQQSVAGPRCAWPRVKLASIEEEVQAKQGPRCAWPRGSTHVLDSLQQSVQEEDVLARNKEVANGAKCAWPRATSRTQERAISSSMNAQEGNVLSFKSSTEDYTNRLSEGPKLKGVSKRLEESNSPAIEGPRCAWPRSTPRRMLATGVGLGLMNYLFISQGAPALAILLQSSFPVTYEENDSLSPHKGLLP